MPALPHASLVIARRTCGSGTGLRGITPGAASWSKGTRRCGEIAETAMFDRYLFTGLTEGGASFTLVPLDPVLAALEVATVVGVTWASLSETPSPSVLADYGGADVPVLFYPAGTGGPTVTVPLTTPVRARLVHGAAHETEFGEDTFIFSPSDPQITTELGKCAITTKLSVLVDCGANAGSYMNEGMDTPSPHICFDHAGAVTETFPDLRKFRILQCVPDAYHIEYQTAVRVADAESVALCAPLNVLAAGTYTNDAPFFSAANYDIGDSTTLADTACP